MALIDHYIASIVKRNPELSGLIPVIEKEIIHHELMMILRDEDVFDKLVFMGGTALRACYGSSRLSEDLDFTGGLNFDPSSLDGLGSVIEERLSEKLGQSITVTEPKINDSDTSTWKVSIERQSNRPDIPTQKIHIDICAYDSLDVHMVALKDHYQIHPKTLGTPFPTQSKEEILADKLIALAYRNRIKPRDLWDIVWLDQQGVKTNCSFVEKKLLMRGHEVKDFKSKIEEATLMVRYNGQTKQDFDKEMKRFLPLEVAKNSIEDDSFYTYLSNTISDKGEEVINKITQPKNKPKFDMS